MSKNKKSFEYNGLEFDGASIYPTMFPENHRKTGKRQFQEPSKDPKVENACKDPRKLLTFDDLASLISVGK
jgi:hypothetical protein